MTAGPEGGRSIAMTATVLWKRAREVRQAPGPAARQRSEQTFT